MSADDDTVEVKSSPKTTADTKRRRGKQRPASAVPTADASQDIPVADSSPKPGHVVGIGASAGGLAALQSLFDHIPRNSGAAFVVVQHLSPNFKTLMDELLSRHSGMTVKLADDGDTLKANHVYVMRPNRNIIVKDGALLLQPIDRESSPNLPIDRFFNSLAAEYENCSVGMVLSGTGSDGSIGIKALRDVGGLVLVQEPAEAEFDGMPAAAIRTGYVDSVADIDLLAKQLVAYLKNPTAISENTEFREHLANNQETLESILKRLTLAAGVDFSLYKPAMVSRRFEHRMGIWGVKTLPEYAQVLDRKPEEFALLKSDLLIGVTQFFRDQDCWQSLVKPVISSLISSKRDDSSVRVWMVGVSSGEEVYSMAMLLSEYMQAKSMSKSIKIFATDVNASAIEYASTGVYPPHICRDISEERLARFFKQDEGGNYVISRALRNMVVFATHNVLEDPPFSNMDLVVCRNMLIYLLSEAQERVLGIFNFALRNEGYLWLGNSESITSGDDSFKEVNSSAKIWKKVSTSKRLIPPHITLEKLRRRPSENKYLDSTRLSQANFEKTPLQSLSTYSKDIRNRILEEFGPTGVLLGADLHVKQVFGDCSQYMGFYSSDQVSTHIDSLLSPTLGIPVATCIARVAEEDEGEFSLTGIPYYSDSPGHRKNIETLNRDTWNTGATGQVKSGQGDSDQSAVEHGQEQQPLFVDVTVKKFTDDQQTFYLLLLSHNSVASSAVEVVANVAGNSREQYNADVHTRERLRDLDLQLLDSKQELRNAYAELDTTSEELQSTNEELMAANEELQSTNEELQSVNEELFSVNTEYQEKIAELMELNTDLDNLLNSTGYAIIFLDSTLAIRRYTPGMSKYIHLLPGDIERTITDFSFDVNYSDMIDDLNTVLQTGTVIVKRLRTLKSNEQVTVSINPYISSDKSVNGVVMTIQEPDTSMM